MKRSHIKSFAGILISALILVGCGKKEEPAAPTPPVVLVTTAEKADIPIFSEAIATLEGSTNSQIHAQISGYLLKKNYNEGSQVKEGDLLFEIDPKPFQANLDKANATLQNSQSQLTRTQQDLARYASLVKSGAVSQQEYQNEVQTVQSAQADVDAAQASVTSAQIELGYTNITAPITGIAGKAMAQVGDLISPSVQLTTISALDPIEAVFTVTEQFYLDNTEQIAKAMLIPQNERPERMELLFADGTAYPKKGRFEYVNRQVQTSTGAISVYALFPNPDNILRPGMYAKVRAVTQNISNAVLIPQRCVNELQGINQVVVIKPGNIVEIRNVTLGQQVGSSWIVTSGLESGEHVVVEGIQKCQPGEPVTPEPYAPDTAAPSTNSAPVTPATP
ncbi:MAG TPA: efflux RND transporter periplasmic adaptor subunit [Candidatus Methylacidiphilales bacterium]|jgi:membrane fusion protein (multidrug efflux system)|nr:efflux RND transporter periplasmic adaptor subunit [Candidatus Methylacidiphilales bacterium]